MSAHDGSEIRINEEARSVCRRIRIKKNIGYANAPCAEIGSRDAGGIVDRKRSPSHASSRRRCRRGA